jgi:hypothetical protein
MVEAYSERLRSRISVLRPVGATPSGAPAGSLITFRGRDRIIGKSGSVTAVRVALGAFLVAHGLVHLLYVVPVQDPGFPFSLKESWMVPETVRHSAGIVLMTSAIAAFALLGLAVWGVPGLSSVWPAIAVVSAALSLALLAAFWDRQLFLGVGIDVALIVLALAHPPWIDRVAG